MIAAPADGAPSPRRRGRSRSLRRSAREVVATEATVGGGSLPGETLPSFGVGVAGGRADALARRAPARAAVGHRRGSSDGRVVLDLRTVEPDRDGDLAAAIRAAHRLIAVTVVVGTAGHIDHGKTTLLRALTGIDADRLPEEQRRGMTIDVGYAHLALDDGTELDFVDVPGHDRLVGNMLVGAGEIDAAMLVVAADDGPRAQTLEHLELLDALGIADGLAVVTKADAVDAGAGRPRWSPTVRALLRPDDARAARRSCSPRRDRRGARRGPAGTRSALRDRSSGTAADASAAAPRLAIDRVVRRPRPRARS